MPDVLPESIKPFFIWKKLNFYELLILILSWYFYRRKQTFCLPNFCNKTAANELENPWSFRTIHSWDLKDFTLHTMPLLGNVMLWGPWTAQHRSRYLLYFFLWLRMLRAFWTVPNFCLHTSENYACACWKTVIIMIQLSQSSLSKLTYRGKCLFLCKRQKHSSSLKPTWYTFLRFQSR